MSLILYRNKTLYADMSYFEDGLPNVNKRQDKIHVAKDKSLAWASTGRVWSESQLAHIETMIRIGLTELGKDVQPADAFSKLVDFVAANHESHGASFIILTKKHVVDISSSESVRFRDTNDENVVFFSGTGRNVVLMMGHPSYGYDIDEIFKRASFISGTVVPEYTKISAQSLRAFKPLILKKEAA